MIIYLKNSVSDDFDHPAVVGGEGDVAPPHQDDNDEGKLIDRSNPANKHVALPEVHVYVNQPPAAVHAPSATPVRKLRQTPARVKWADNHAHLSQEVDVSDLIAYEFGLVATLTGKLPADIEHYKQAMLNELKALEDLGVYEEVDVAPGTHIIGVKWVLKEKKVTSLSPAKLKARLVAQGFTQQYGINYEETHASVAKTASIRSVFAVCAANG